MAACWRTTSAQAAANRSRHGWMIYARSSCSRADAAKTTSARDGRVRWSPWRAAYPWPWSETTAWRASPAPPSGRSGDIRLGHHGPPCAASPRMSRSRGSDSRKPAWSYSLSCDSGMSIEPSRYFTGPAAVGLMSKSKICVGSHNVAQAFGTSTTPLMWPCTGAVPRIE